MKHVELLQGASNLRSLLKQSARTKSLAKLTLKFGVVFSMYNIENLQYSLSCLPMIYCNTRKGLRQHSSTKHSTYYLQHALFIVYNIYFIRCLLLTAKHADSPGLMSCMCPDTAFSLTPDSIQFWLCSLQAFKT